MAKRKVKSAEELVREARKRKQQEAEAFAPRGGEETYSLRALWERMQDVFGDVPKRAARKAANKRKSYR